MSYLISVIIPVYNVENYLERCLRSVIEQTICENIEILVIEDCSLDNSKEILYRFAAKNNSKERYITIVQHEVNKGQSKARNEGVMRARGEYVFFLDSDDYLSPDCLEILYDTMRISRADVVCAQSSRSLSDGTICSYYEKPNDKITLVGTEPILKGVLSCYFFPVPWNKLIKLSFLKENRISFIEGCYYEDLLWNLDCVEKLKKLLIISNTTYFYQKNESSTTSIMTDKHIESFHKVLTQFRLRIGSFMKNHPQLKVLLTGYYVNTFMIPISLALKPASMKQGKALVNILQSISRLSLSKIITNPYINIKNKIKYLFVYMGSFGYGYLMIIASINKFFSK